MGMKTWQLSCDAGMECIGHSNNSWRSCTDTTIHWELKGSWRASWKVNIIVIENRRSDIPLLLKELFTTFVLCRCLEARKALLPQDHIQVCCFSEYKFMSLKCSHQFSGMHVGMLIILRASTYFVMTTKKRCYLVFLIRTQK